MSSQVGDSPGRRISMTVYVSIVCQLEASGSKPRGPTPPSPPCLDLIREARVRLYSGILSLLPCIQAPGPMTLSPNRHCTADKSCADQIPMRDAEHEPLTAHGRHEGELHGTPPIANGVSVSRDAGGADGYSPLGNHIGSQRGKVILRVAVTSIRSHTAVSVCPMSAFLSLVRSPRSYNSSRCLRSTIGLR